VVDEDGTTVVDCLLTPRSAEPLMAQLQEFGRPVRRAVYTSSHVEFVGGSSVFWMAARYGRRLTSTLLDQPPNLEVFRRLYPECATDFDDEFTTRPVSHTVNEPAWLSPAVSVVPTSGQQRENLVVALPGADVVFAGAMGCFGVTPNCFDGDPAGWADALSDIGELASTVVPGLGPVGGPEELLSLQAYLYACADAEGDPGAIPAGPWDAWPDRHFDEINVERAAMLAQGDDGVPTSMLRLVGLV
jgi:glyoxylase-like metal-dependent hydrolase (beta-lactamase superfamily II)